MLERVVILDGGLATQLEAAGHDLSTDLWSARLLRDEPGAILAAHRTFVDAGAEVVTTASYQASFEGFAAAGIEAGEAARLMRRSVELARAASDADGPRWVAASIGPYGAVLADGQEYTGEYVAADWSGRSSGGLTVAELREFHVRRMSVLAEAGPDVFAVETIPALAEVEAILSALDEVGLPAWVSLTTVVDADGRPRTRRGECAVRAFAMAADCEAVIAVGANCMAPVGAYVIVEAGQAVDMPVVLYPNSAEAWDGAARRWTGSSQHAWDTQQWVAGGTRLLGGCCRIGPADIARLVNLHTRLD